MTGKICCFCHRSLNPPYSGTDRLPCDTAAMILLQLTSLDQLELQIEEIEERIAVALKPSPEVRLLRTVFCRFGPFIILV